MDIMNPKLRRTREEVYADLIASGALVVTDEDRAITNELTSSPAFGLELAERFAEDPDLSERCPR